MVANTVIELTGLFKTYKKPALFKTERSLVLDDLNLSVYEGEIFALLGLNGVGKTTVIKLMLGLLRPDAGQVRILGDSLSSETFRHIGYIPEIPYFPKNLSVQEVLHFYARLSGLSQTQVRQRLPAVLEVVQLNLQADKKVRDCSKGMLQRLSLAQSLLHNPSILIFDEPITGLDPLGLKAMRDIIVFLNKEGKTIVFSSHLINEVERIAHRAGILVKGKLQKVVYASAWQHQSLEDIFMQEQVQA